MVKRWSGPSAEPVQPGPDWSQILRVSSCVWGSSPRPSLSPPCRGAGGGGWVLVQEDRDGGKFCQDTPWAPWGQCALGPRVGRPGGKCRERVSSFPGPCHQAAPTPCRSHLPICLVPRTKSRAGSRGAPLPRGRAGETQGRSPGSMTSSLFHVSLRAPPEPRARPPAPGPQAAQSRPLEGCLRVPSA